MPFCPFISCLPGGLYHAVPMSLAVTVPQAMEFISQHALVSVAVAGVFGLLVGWLAKRRSADGGVSVQVEASASGVPEMKWRHEKLVLVERQQVEKQHRLDAFAETFRHWETKEEQAAALRTFVLAERVREARQKVGSDLSRMKAVRDRLDEIAAPMERGREAVGACRGMAEAQAVRLGEAREALRAIADEILRIERAEEGRGPDFSDLGGLRRHLRDLKGRIVSLPQGWATSGEETDRRIRELLATVDEPALGPVREVLLVDGSLTASLDGVASIDLPGAVGAAIAALDRLAKSKEEKRDEPPSEPEEGEGLPEALISDNSFGEAAFDFGFPAPQAPMPGFLGPESVSISPPRPAKGFHDLTNGVERRPEASSGEVSSLAEEGERSLVLFCSNDVELWGKTIYRGARCRARAIEEFPAWASWISIRRLDTGERVFAPIRTANLRNGQSADPFGFNGTNELFYGARHLGLFSESCPNEVETRFTYGGWGFGHRAHEVAPEVEQLQAAGWEGREIPSDTVFEIVIHEELPSLGPGDRLLEWPKR